jgi:hypothetical protein
MIAKAMVATDGWHYEGHQDETILDYKKTIEGYQRQLDAVQAEVEAGRPHTYQGMDRRYLPPLIWTMLP